MIERQYHGVTLQCVQGDIVQQPDVDAIVNAANAQLRSGGGVAGAIHRAAGPGLEAECRPLAPIRPGEAVITGAHRLPNKFVVHCLGPVYGVDRPSDRLLAACYDNALNVADQAGVRSVAFPAISTGIFGYPVVEAARIALGAVVGRADTLAAVRLVRFVLFSESDYQVHARALDEALSSAAE
jgi:O-acetyl-ADP-ribose deacetylase (regulator of RNase III)